MHTTKPGIYRRSEPSVYSWPQIIADKSPAPDSAAASHSHWPHASGVNRPQRIQPRIKRASAPQRQPGLPETAAAAMSLSCSILLKIGSERIKNEQINGRNCE